MKNRNALLIIDAQKDFCEPEGALYVQGAEQDVQRIADLIKKFSDRIDYISLTQDSHHRNDIAHPAWWTKRDGSPVNAFTPISLQQVKDGEFVPTI